MERISLDNVGPENLSECGIGCLTSPGNQGFQPKVEWVRRHFAEGLRFLMFSDEAGRPLAFLEYVPGEFAWRPVDAPGWLFVHCLWVYSRGQKVGGLGSRLVQACVDEARLQRAIGVAAIVSSGPWMAGKRIFLMNGFRQIDKADRFQLVMHRLVDGPEPRFRDISGNVAKYQGLHIVFCAQCPMLPKSVNDLREMAAEHGLKLHVTVLTSAREAQNAPSYYGVFNLILERATAFGPLREQGAVQTPPGAPNPSGKPNPPGKPAGPYRDGKGHVMTIACRASVRSVP